VSGVSWMLVRAEDLRVSAVRWREIVARARRGEILPARVLPALSDLGEALEFSRRAVFGAFRVPAEMVGARRRR
jgi:hypothetical protein